MVRIVLVGLALVSMGMLGACSMPGSSSKSDPCRRIEEKFAAEDARG